MIDIDRADRGGRIVKGPRGSGWSGGTCYADCCSFWSVPCHGRLDIRFLIHSLAETLWLMKHAVNALPVPFRCYAVGQAAQDCCWEFDSCLAWIARWGFLNHLKPMNGNHWQQKQSGSCRNTVVMGCFPLPPVIARKPRWIQLPIVFGMVALCVCACPYLPNTIFSSSMQAWSRIVCCVFCL